jgi:hypothetical protein
MKKMLKRADGSKSRRGLWDNIRANKGSGKQPTKEMLKQEKKIKAKKYQTAGFDKQAAMAKELGMVKDSTGKWVNPPKTNAPASTTSTLDNISYGLKSMFTTPTTNVRSEVAGIRRKTGGKSDWLSESKELKFGGKSKKRMGGKNC